VRLPALLVSPSEKFTIQESCGLVAICETTQGDDVQWYLPPGTPGKEVVLIAGPVRVKSTSESSSMRVGRRQLRPASVSVAQ
jgi:hypothetical protein